VSVQAENVPPKGMELLSDTISVSFKEYGDKYQATLFDSELIDLIKNGKKISKNELPEFEDLVMTKIRKNSGFGIRLKHFNLDSLNTNIFRLDSCKGFEIFKSEEFRENMRNLKEKIKSLKLEIELDSLDKGLLNFSDELDSCLGNKIKIYLDKGKHNRQRIHIQRNNKTYIDKEIDIEEGISDFKDELKNELIKDGLIKESDDSYSIEISPDEMVVNDKKTDSEIHQKYLGLYEAKFGKQLKGEYKLKINN